MLTKVFTTCFLLLATYASSAQPSTNGILQKKPRLILFIAIDQFRADYLTRFASQFLPAKDANGKLGGFRHLMASGAYFPYATFEILQNMTGPGHATMLTGAYPYQMGIPLNEWFADGRYVYCVEDAGVSTVGSSSKGGHRSPRNLIGTTVGDEIKNAGYPGQVVAIALKDRSAILMGGHRADFAFWLDPSAFQWISSDYYLPDKKLPAWVKKENAALAKRASKDVAREKTVEGLTLTSDLVKKAVQELDLGKNPGPDLLAVSFSSFDYRGHMFGPNSREMEEMTVAADKTLAHIFNFLKANIPGGLADILIVLTSDHGVAPNPDYAKASKLDAGRIDLEKVAEEVGKSLSDRFGAASESWFSYMTDLNFYLNRKVLASKSLKLADVEAFAKESLSKYPWAAFVFTSSDHKNGQLPPGIIGEQILRTYVAGRSGDVVVVPKPFYISTGNVVDHMTGYSYDRTVPIIFAGAHIEPGLYFDEARVVDIAPTLSALAGVLPPALSEGRILNMMFKAR